VAARPASRSGRSASSDERRPGRSLDDDLRQHGDHLAPGHRIAELLGEDVADHAVGLRAEHVERCPVPIGGGLEDEQSHLRAVAVGHDEIVIARQLGQRASGDPRVGPLRRQASGSPRRRSALPPSEATTLMRGRTSTGQGASCTSLVDVLPSMSRRTGP
jgi:hypothetical protein